MLLANAKTASIIKPTHEKVGVPVMGFKIKAPAPF